jgi:predicted transcriptional regulator
MNFVQFKSNMFGGVWGLNTTEIALLMFITMQERSKFIFYKNKIMAALSIKDVRTINRALDSLAEKGIITRIPTASRGMYIYIRMLDKIEFETDTDTDSVDAEESAGAEQTAEEPQAEQVTETETESESESEKDTEPVSEEKPRGNYSDYPNMADVLPAGFSDMFAK